MRKTSVEKKIITVKMLILVSYIIMGFLCFKLWNINFKKTETVANNKMYKIYIETGFGTDTYTTSTSNVFPTEGYVLNTSLTTCIGGGTISQESSFINALFNSSDSCKLYFDVDNSQASVTGVATILNLVGDADDTSTAIIEGTELAYDGTTDKNLRYVGYDGTNNKPNNYIDIGDTSSLWRIIGVFNNIDDGTGKSETRLKIMRDNPLMWYNDSGSSYSIGYSWDSSANSINNACGINQWGPSGSYEGADLMRELNGDYLNTNLTNNTKWYTDNNTLSATFNKSNVLSLSAQDLIGDALWYTGASLRQNESSALMRDYYQYERGSLTGNICSGSFCNDTVVRTTTWVGKIALPYVSDYGFGTAGSGEVSRENCLNALVENWYCDDEEDDWKECGCTEGTWVNDAAIKTTVNGQSDIMTITPSSYPYSNSLICVFSDDDTGVYHAYVNGNSTMITVPTTFLKANVVITGGTGAKTDPYIAALP